LSSPPLSLSLPHRQPPTTTLFPYTTLFRSLYRISIANFARSSTSAWLKQTRIRTSSRAERSRPAANVDCPPQLSVTAQHRRYRRSEEHTSELQSRRDLVCRLLLEKKKTKVQRPGWRQRRATRDASPARCRSGRENY